MTELRPIIGLFILCFLGWQRIRPRKKRLLPLWLFAPAGLVAGFLAMFVGATGPFIAPLFLRDDLEPEEIVGTKAALQVVTHTLKIPAFLALQFHYEAFARELAVLAAAVIVGTYAGRRVLAKIDRRVFMAIFEVVLAGVALFLIKSSAVDFA